jgi:muramoyltetrapeptide carboxypeptidase
MSRPGHLSRPVLAQLTDEPIHYTDSSLVNYGTTGTAGKAEGRLVGGNLTIVCALLGTPFEIQTADRILFLEEVNEEPYRIDRMLTQLWLASKLQQCAGIVLGKFSKSEASNEFTPSYNLDEVLRSRLEPLGIPVLAGFQFGHVKSKCTLPVGALAELDADAKKLTILERPVLFPES